MAQSAQAAFFSYSRDDSEFAIRLAEDLKAAGANVWMDQLDIEPGTPWDRAVEDAVTTCPHMLVILSPTSVNSDNVRDEISFALSKRKRVIPVLYRECDVPFRLARLQHIDFRTNYARGLKTLLKILIVEGQSADARDAEVHGVPRESLTEVSDPDARRDLNQVRSRRTNPRQPRGPITGQSTNLEAKVLKNLEDLAESIEEFSFLIVENVKTKKFVQVFSVGKHTTLTVDLPVVSLSKAERSSATRLCASIGGRIERWKIGAGMAREQGNLDDDESSFTFDCGKNPQLAASVVLRIFAEVHDLNGLKIKDLKFKKGP